MLYIVGVGVAEGYLTERAIKLIREAEVVYGSKRAIELAKRYIRGETRIMTNFGEEIYREIEDEAENRRVVVLSTGDPMVSGLGRFLKGEIEPGISSVQLALAKLKLDLTDVVVVDSHAKESYEEIKRALKLRGKVLVLADRNFDLKKINENVRVVVLEDLGLDGERVGDTITSDRAIVYLELGSHKVKEKIKAR